MWCSIKKEVFLFTFPCRALPQTTCLQHQPQPNRQTPFPLCSLLLLLVPSGTVPPLARLLLSQLKSTCLQNLCLISDSVFLFLCRALSHKVESEPDGNDDAHRIQTVGFILKQNVTFSFSPVHCWTWIHYPLQVLQHHQPHLHLGEVSSLVPSDLKFISCEIAFQVLDIVVAWLNTAPPFFLDVLLAQIFLGQVSTVPVQLQCNV